MTEVMELEPTGKPLVDDMRHWANVYARSSGGRMKVLDYFPKKYPGQKGVSVETEQLSNLGFIATMANAAARDQFGAILETLETHADNNPFVDNIGEALAAGTNVEMVTNHGELIDIAIAQAALYTVLHRRGHKHMQTGIVINKMIAFLSHEFFEDYIPCTNVLKLLENETFLSIPRTKSAREHLLSAEDSARVRAGIVGHNLHVNARIDRKLKKGGLLLAMAASGSTDKPLDDNPSIISMETISSGTIKLMQKPRTLVAPFAAWFQAEKMVLQPADDTLRHVEKDEDKEPQHQDEEAHLVMHNIANVLTDQVPDKTFTYQEAA